MAAVLMINSAQNAAVDTIEPMYTDGGSGTRITAFTASNSGPSSVTYQAYIYDSSGSELPAVVPQTIVVKDRSSLGAQLLGQFIPQGGSLRLESSGPLTFRATGDVV